MPAGDSAQLRSCGCAMCRADGVLRAVRGTTPSTHSQQDAVQDAQRRRCSPQTRVALLMGLALLRTIRWGHFAAR